MLHQTYSGKVIHIVIIGAWAFKSASSAIHYSMLTIHGLTAYELWSGATLDHTDYGVCRRTRAGRLTSGTISE